VNDWVTVADANALDLTSNMTLMAWVKPTAIDVDWRTVLFKERSGGLAYALYAADGASRPPAGYIHRANNDRAVVGSSLLPTVAWTHLAFTYNGSTMRLYVNGAQVATRTQNGAAVTSSGALRIGGNSIWGEYFAGVIDEVRIYNRALTATEVQTTMNLAIDGGALMAAAKPPASAAGDSRRGLSDIGPLMNEAKRRLRNAGLTTAQSSALDSVQVRVVNLPGGQLGQYSLGTVLLDRDAAGFGWYIDRSPRSDAEFATGRPAVAGMDLLTVLTHELGHAIGLEHADDADYFMADRLAPGARRVPVSSAIQHPSLEELVHLLATDHDAHRRVPGR
jgi:concanavalin A-like lectin/glucanase superfamily protein/matrixin